MGRTKYSSAERSWALCRGPVHAGTDSGALRRAAQAGLCNGSAASVTETQAPSREELQPRRPLHLSVGCEFREGKHALRHSDTPQRGSPKPSSKHSQLCQLRWRFRCLKGQILGLLKPQFRGFKTPEQKKEPYFHRKKQEQRPLIWKQFQNSTSQKKNLA